MSQTTKTTTTTTSSAKPVIIMTKPKPKGKKIRKKSKSPSPPLMTKSVSPSPEPVSEAESDEDKFCCACEEVIADFDSARENSDGSFCCEDCMDAESEPESEPEPEPVKKAESSFSVAQQKQFGGYESYLAEALRKTESKTKEKLSYEETYALFIHKNKTSREEMNMYENLGEEEYNKMDKRGVELMIKYNQMITPEGSRTERCSFKFQINMTKTMLRTLKYYIKPTSDKSESYTDVALKSALNQFFFNKFENLMSMELVGRTRACDNGDIIDVPTNYFEEQFCDGYLYKEGRKHLDTAQDIHEQSIKKQRKTKIKEIHTSNVKHTLDNMSKEERDALFAEYMNKEMRYSPMKK